MTGRPARPAPLPRPRLSLRIEECACRGLIVAGNDPVTWQLVLDAHYAGDQHRLWEHLLAGDKP